jgi:alkylation response protein AidB-like acyl-CoA dehydrogenase
MIKLWIPEAAGRVIDKAIQLFGGSGYMDEMPISRLYKANRLHRIYAGTDELQKIAIARSL